MMDAMWLVLTSEDRFTALRDRVLSCDRSARTVLVADVGSAVSVAGALAPTTPDLNAMLELPASELPGAVGELRRGCAGMGRIAVIVDACDPAAVAGAVAAGATEVIVDATGSGDAYESDAGAVCAIERGPAAPEPVVDEPRVCPKRDGAKAAPSASLGNQTGAPPYPAEMQRYLDELDEPDINMLFDDDDADGTGSMTAARRDEPAGISRGAASPDPSSGASAHGPRAPVVAVLSGQGGTGRSTLVAAMAAAAAQAGLRAAVLDLDLMFGRLPAIFGVERPQDLAQLIEPARRGALREEELVRASMRVGPGLTLWGPARLPEQAELLGPVTERLIGVLRAESDIIFADTSVFWGDAVAAAVAESDRLLIVSDGRQGSDAASVRAIELATRIGVPRTRMTSVLNRLGRAGSGEDERARFEFACGLSSRAAVADGGDEIAAFADVGRLSDCLARPGPFADDVRALVAQIAIELGCAVDRAALEAPVREDEPRTRRIRLPWRHGEDDRE